MNIYITYTLIALLLVAAELIYFRIADKFNIIDKPNQRSSHSSIVLRGGGIIFLFGAWLYAAFFGLQYPWFLLGLTMIAGVSFVDDVKSVPNKVRLLVHFVSMLLMFYQIGMLQWSLWWVVLIALVVCVGATNVINFMDGINGITVGYSLAVVVPLVFVNRVVPFIDPNFLYVVIASLLVFAFFNFRGRGKAKCFAGDVGAIGIAFIMLFALGCLIMKTGDVTWLIFLLVYGVDGCLTICHRILLHEDLGEAHRKHAYQLMANELGLSHPLVSGIYMALQLAVSLGFIYVCPNTVLAHWIYLICAVIVLAIVYILFKKKYYYLHEEYLKSKKA